jgi:hypothetical protein
VTWFRQRRNWPRGHDLLAEDPRTEIAKPVELRHVRHEHMDELLSFHDRSLEIAAE